MRGIAAIAAALVMVGGCSSEPERLTVQGSMTVVGSCTPTGGGSRGFQDIEPGAAVEVTDASGTLIAMGRLEPEPVADRQVGSCRYPFTVDGVPAGHDFYGVHVGNENRGVVKVPANKIHEPVELSLSRY